MESWISMLTYQDERVLHRLVTSRRRIVAHVMRGVTHLGDAAVVVSLVLVLMLDLVPGTGRAGWVAAFALVVSHAMVQLLKRTITRPRPRLPVGIGSLIDAPDRFSFPSGHAAASASLGLALAAMTPLPLAAGLVALCVLVGVSRCYLGVHYPSDVLAGWALAGGALLAAEPALTWIGVLPL